MNAIKLKTWILWILILFFLGLATDYFFLHVLFPTKMDSAKDVVAATVNLNTTKNLPTHTFETPVSEEKKENPEPQEDNFRDSLEKCAPEIAAQGLGTPEALIEYLKKSVGMANEEIDLENFHLTLPDGTHRRIQLVIADNTNSTSKKELRLFKLDQEGFPERLTLSPGDTLQSLLALGELTQHEVKSRISLKDGSSLLLEMHNNQVFELQFNNLGHLLSCRYSSCHCP